MESKTHHLKHIATQIGNLIHKFISKINVPCSKSFGVCISKDIIADLLDKLREGYATTVVTCGATKAGKSTFLNYLIGVDSDILAEQFVPMFLTKVEAETTACWALKTRKDLGSDEIEVRSVDCHGETSKGVKFTKITSYCDYIELNYSRAVIEKLKKEKGGVNPFKCIEIDYGTPSTILNKNIFSEGFHLVDTQGLSEAGATLQLKDTLKQKFFILICCINYAQGFAKTEQYTQLRKIFCDDNSGQKSTLAPAHILFVFTFVDESLKGIERDLNKKGPPQFKAKPNYEVSIKQLTSNIKEELTKDFKNIPHDIFLSDYSSDCKQIEFAVSSVRRRIVELRNDLKFEENFLKSQIQRFSHEIEIFKINLINTARMAYNKNFEANLRREKFLFDRVFNSANDDFIKELVIYVNKHFFDKVVQLARNRKEIFMQDKPNPRALHKKLADWFINEGFNNAISAIIEDCTSIFITSLFDTLRQLFIKSFISIKSTIMSCEENKHLHDQIAQMFDEAKKEIIYDIVVPKGSQILFGVYVGVATTGSIAMLATEVSALILLGPIALGVGAAVGVFAFWMMPNKMKMYKYATNFFYAADFDKVYTEMLRDITKPFLENNEAVNNACTTIADKQINELQNRFEAYFNRELSKIDETSADEAISHIESKDFDVEEIHDIEKELLSYFEEINGF
jgi:hypothetical protein